MIQTLLSLIEDLHPLRIVTVGPDESVAAVRILRKFANQGLTLTDAVGLHVMKALRVGRCWSTDFHLGLTGVPLVCQKH